MANAGYTTRHSLTFRLRLTSLLPECLPRPDIIALAPAMGIVLH